MTPGVRRIIWLVLALIVFPLLVLLGLETYLVVGTAPELKRNRELVAHTFEFISTAQSLDTAIQDAERGQRGFLITGDRDYLEPYETGAKEIPALLARLEQLAAGNPEHQRRIQELERQTDIKLRELKGSLDMFDAAGIEAARQVLRSNIGFNAMKIIGDLIDGMVTAEQFQLTDQLARAADQERRTTDIGMIGGLLAFAIMMLGVVLGWLSLRQIIRVEAARHESEERFRLLVENVTDYAIYMLDTDGHVTTWNAGAERIKGYTADEILGRHFSCFYTEDDRRRDAPAHALAAAREGRYEAEVWRSRKNGERFFASVVINPLRDRTGKLMGFAKITRDISERMEQQRALEQARAELAQSQKMEALGQLSGGIAHDFNNVLQVINNAIAILQRRLQDGNPEVDKFLNLIKRNADRAAALTQRLLAFSRAQTLDPRRIDPNALVSGMADLLQQTLGKSVGIKTMLCADVWEINADSNQLETAIVNLAVNARDAMPQGGELGIETANVVLDENYEKAHPDAKAGEYVSISVSDCGTGMTEEVLAKAFDPFFTTKEPGQGTGLGLSQVFGFIKQSGGHVTVQSAPGAGTVVRLYLPRRTESCEEADDARTQVAESTRTPVSLFPPAERKIGVRDGGIT